MKKITAFTDGSACIKGEKLGGFGVYIIDGEKEHFLSKGYKNTKTGRQELMAVINCLRFIEDKTSQVLIYSDSKYAIGVIMEGWLQKWENECWQYNKNTDLCLLLKQEVSKFEKQGGKVIMKHIKGHQDNLEDFIVNGNNIADILASYRNFSHYETDLK